MGHSVEMQEKYRKRDEDESYRDFGYRPKSSRTFEGAHNKIGGGRSAENDTPLSAPNIELALQAVDEISKFSGKRQAPRKKSMRQTEALLSVRHLYSTRNKKQRQYDCIYKNIYHNKDVDEPFGVSYHDIWNETPGCDSILLGKWVRSLEKHLEVR